jgi:hypothetical protein
MEEREQVTRIGIVRVNGQPEELDGPDGRRQPSVGGTSRISREAYVRICERLGVQFPGATRRSAGNRRPYADLVAKQEVEPPVGSGRNTAIYRPIPKNEVARGTGGRQYSSFVRVDLSGG